MNARAALKPDVIRKLENIQLRARGVVEGFLAGLHRSPYHGFSAEFAQHRPYHPGDPLRSVDWKGYARSEKLVVKEFHEETNLRATLLVDGSGSMAFASPAANGVTKFQYATDLAAALAFLMLNQRDAVGLIRCDTELREFLPPRSLRSHLTVLLSSLENSTPGGDTSLGPVLHTVAELIKRRGLIIILSDLMDDPDEILKGLSHFRYNGHEVLIFQILDPWERTLNVPFDARFIDLETGGELLTRPRQLAPAYRKRMNEFLERLRMETLNRGIELVQLTTDEPYDTALLKYLSHRSRLS